MGLEHHVYACLKNNTVENLIFANSEFVDKIKSEWDQIVDVNDLSPFYPPIGSIYDVDNEVFTDSILFSETIEENILEEPSE